MKYLFFACLLLTAPAAFSQRSRTYTMKCLPDRRYGIMSHISVQCTVNLGNIDSINAKVKGRGNIQPVSLRILRDWRGQVINGKTTIYEHHMNFRLGGQSINVPLDQQDSVAAVTFPDHPLKIGDSFTREQPLGIPMAGNATIKATYQLVHIRKGMATFQLTETVDTRLLNKQLALSLTGSGTGKLIYSLKNQYPAYEQNELKFKVKGKAKARLINGAGTLETKRDYTVN